jgi:hypothetical protein
LWRRSRGGFSITPLRYDCVSTSISPTYSLHFLMYKKQPRTLGLVGLESGTDTCGDAVVVDSVSHRLDTLQKWERPWHAGLWRAKVFPIFEAYLSGVILNPPRLRLHKYQSHLLITLVHHSLGRPTPESLVVFYTLRNVMSRWD